MQSIKVHFQGSAGDTAQAQSEPSTCIEAEPFALRVLDDSMEPEFRQGCIIVIDPTGHARDGSYVLAREPADGDRDETDGYLFRQLAGSAERGWQLRPLNPAYASCDAKLSDISGVIVQRAGVRRRYHKRYD